MTFLKLLLVFLFAWLAVRYALKLRPRRNLFKSRSWIDQLRSKQNAREQQRREHDDRN